jgi:hypothetical protein
VEDDAPITGMIPVGDSLMVLKGDTQLDGTVYFLTPMETGIDVKPIEYKSTHGLYGVGCLGACANFLDDPVFISRLGVEAIGQLSVRLERAMEHRSSLIDAALVNLDLKNAVIEEWNGYLMVLVDGKIFMADSRQRYTHESGVVQYEWYYLENIGVWEGQYPEYVYQGFIETDPLKIRLLQSFKATKNQIYTKLIIPSSFSNIISALKINVSMSLIGVIMGEFLVSKEGIGYLIMYGSQVFNLNLVITGVFILCVVSAVMYYLVSYLEKRLIKND